MSLTDELNKPEYQSGSLADRLALLRSKTSPAVGRIEQGQLKVLEAMIAAGRWRDKMDAIKAAANATLADPDAAMGDKQLANITLQVVAGFHEAISEAKLANKAPFELGGHSVNMADPMVQQTFGAAQMAGIALITPAESAKVMELATYQKQLWPSASMYDVVAHFEPELLDNQWHDLPETNARNLILRLTSAPPEPTYIAVEIRDNYGDGTKSAWYPATSLHFQLILKEYRVPIPHNGYPREIRWRCPYVLGASVSVA